MEKRTLGGRGPALPVVGMGTWKTFDVRGSAEEKARHEIVSEALRSGAQLFDSSPMYGEAERVLGDALRERRKEAFVATKVWARADGEMETQIEASLKFFGGAIDLYQVHNLSRVEEVLPRILDLRSTGQVGKVGATHYRPHAFGDLAKLMESGKIDAVQIPYNARDREAELRLLPLAEELGLGVLVMEPLGTGGLVQTSPPPELLPRLRHKGVETWGQVLLKWILSDPRVDVILPATARRGRPAENAKAGAPPWFDAEEREAVSAVFGSSRRASA